MNETAARLVEILSPVLMERASPEFHDLVEFFIDTAAEISQGSGNICDGLLTAWVVNALSPGESEALEHKIFDRAKEKP